MKNSICLIPARKGSKRIKNKNIKSFFGKPIIFYSIKVAKSTNLFKEIYVSTDSKKIQKISIQYGAVCKSLRKKNLATDQSKTFNVIKDFVKQLKDPPEIICCLYPAAPFVKKTHIKKAFKILKSNKNLDIVMPVSEYNNNPLRSLEIRKKILKPKNRKKFLLNSNNLNKLYYDTGSFYLLRTSFIKKSKSFFPSKTQALIIKKNSYVDLNDNEDWKLAKKLFV